MGVLLDRLVQPAWVHRVLADLLASPIVEVVLVGIDDSAPGNEGVVRQLQRHRDLALYTLYTAADDFLFGERQLGQALIGPGSGSPDADPLAPMELGGIDKATRLRLDPVRTGGRWSLAPADVDAIVRNRLDVALWLGPEAPAGRHENIARYGLWWLHHGDIDRFRGGPPGFWEVMGNEAVTGSALLVQAEGHGDTIVVDRSYASTDRYSVRRSKNNFYWTAGALILRQLCRLHEGRDGMLREAAERSGQFAPYSEPLRRHPGNRQMAGLLARHACRVAQDRVQHRLLPERWALAYRLGSGVPSMHDFQQLTPPGDAEWADPFPVEHLGRHHVFFEEQPSNRAPAHISVLELTADGRWNGPERVLSADHHLSYPFVFRWNGCHYMIPETVGTRRVELYRCVEFPLRWELDTVLLEDVRAVDATVAQVGNRWWMFVSIAVEGARDYDELHLFSAERPTGPWRPHRHNPVKSDARSSRPAGRLFTWRGRLHRPAQDCGRRYGYAVSMNQVLRLDDESFEEREVGRIEPNWDKGIVATHTLNMAAGLTVVDVRLRGPLLASSRTSADHG